MDQSSMEELFKRYYDQSATAEQTEQLFRMIKEAGDTELLALIESEGMKLEQAAPEDQHHIEPGIAANGLEKILQVGKLGKDAATHEKSAGKDAGREIKISRMWRYAAAAVIILSVAGYIFFRNTGEKPIAVQTIPARQPDLAPGGSKAILTLADGHQIILDNAANGSLSTQGHVKVIKLNDGQVSYESTGNTHEIAYNTISTPNGGQYQLILSDGSKVWLNAASSLRYPTSFTGNEREVQLTGEGYFEITHDAAKPFHVMVNETRIEVLGTHFNINAYTDEPALTTTLLEGKIKLDNHGALSLLKPGQQASITEPGKIKVSDHADLEEAVAWKNGKFIFNGNSIQSIMRQLARWYDFRVEYKDNLPNDEYIGAIRRSENISAILHILEKTKTISFQINGKLVTVAPYKN